jgi:hypothetical protein
MSHKDPRCYQSLEEQIKSISINFKARALLEINRYKTIYSDEFDHMSSRFQQLYHITNMIRMQQIITCLSFVTMIHACGGQVSSDTCKEKIQSRKTVGL